MINARIYRKLVMQGARFWGPGQQVPWHVPFIGGRVVPEGSVAFWMAGTASIQPATWWVVREALRKGREES